MPSYLFMLETDDDEMIMWLEDEDGVIIRFLDEEEIQFHLTPYLKRKRGEMNEDNEDWEDENFKVIQGVKFIKTRCGIYEADEQDTDMEQITKKMKLCEHNEKKRKAKD